MIKMIKRIFGGRAETLKFKTEIFNLYKKERNNLGWREFEAEMDRISKKYNRTQNQTISALMDHYENE